MKDARGTALRTLAFVPSSADAACQQAARGAPGGAAGLGPGPHLAGCPSCCSHREHVFVPRGPPLHKHSPVLFASLSLLPSPSPSLTVWLDLPHTLSPLPPPRALGSAPLPGLTLRLCVRRRLRACLPSPFSTGCMTTCPVPLSRSRCLQCSGSTGTGLNSFCSLVMGR